MPYSDRFGGSYHMLEEGEDKNGLWDILNRFVLYVHWRPKQRYCSID